MYQRYKQIRDRCGMTDNAVAVAAGIPQSSLYDWKQRSAKNPGASMSLTNMQKIANVFGVTLEELIGDSNEHTKH